MLARSDAFRRPKRFEKFLLACEADARGRAGLEERDYPQADFLRGAFAAASNVDAAEIAADKEGAEIGKALSSARTRAVKQYRKNFQVPP
jgi:tRNA nucleotidyltransferase (CCA-adding enzyme)